MTARAFQLRVRILGIEPEIWRRILIPADMNLFDLHVAIQGAMGWEDSHLHSFEIRGQQFELPEDKRSGPEPGYKDERKAGLNALLSKGAAFRYIYDFGDEWEHVVDVEDVLAPAEDRTMPCCIDGARACPPEDCGGPDGYAELLLALADTARPDHHDRLEWAGEYDPEDFDATVANKSMAEARARYGKRR